MGLVDALPMFFLLGAVAGLVRSDLRLPRGLYDTLSIYLLLAIGLKGGMALAEQASPKLLPQSLAVIAFGVVLPLLAFPLLRHLGRLNKADAACIAAHYGSVSVGTFAVGVAFLHAKGISFESYMPLFVVLLEMPAIAVGIWLAKQKGNLPADAWGKLLHEVFLNKGMLLMGGGLVIGWVGGPEGLTSVKPFFIDLFYGALALFLVEMGLIAADRLGDLRERALFLISYGVLMPLFGGATGALLGLGLGLSAGGAILLAVLGASASYIAVPAAMKIAVPEARLNLAIAASLGVTFPFNVLLGIPLYTWFVHWL